MRNIIVAIWGEPIASDIEYVKLAKRLGDHTIIVGDSELWAEMKCVDEFVYCASPEGLDYIMDNLVLSGKRGIFFGEPTKFIEALSRQYNFEIINLEK